MEEKNIKVLVTDDEDDFRLLMSFWLQSKGYQVIAASNGEEAIKLIQSESPDIVFMDLNMPVMDGAETIKKVREFNKDIPIILISAYLDDVKVKDATSHGIAGVFFKGKDFSQGLSLLETVLRKHKQLRK